MLPHFCFFFNDTATTEIYTLSLHDALPILSGIIHPRKLPLWKRNCSRRSIPARAISRSEEHTSELQSRQYLVCRLLLEKKKHPQALKGKDNPHRDQRVVDPKKAVHETHLLP